ncbi:MAG: glycosyltransferase [Ignavibacteriaceae bacterium]|nr:glycosyltransferase [Ignavibacteriaceae bacterium]
MSNKSGSIEKQITTIVPLKNGNGQILHNIKNLINSQPFESSKVYVSIEDSNEPLYSALKLIEDVENNFGVFIAGKPKGVNGKASNMLAAYNITDSEFVVFMDADVLVKKANYHDLLNSFEDERCGAVFSAAFYHQANTIGGRMIRAVTNYFFGEAVLLFERVIKMNYCAGAFMGFRKSALDKAGGLNAVLNYISDDATLGNNIYNVGYKIKILNTPVFMPEEKLKLKEGVNHLIKWMVIVKQTMGGNYFFVPATFYTGNVILLLALSIVTGELIIFSLLLVIFATAFRIFTAALQDKMLFGEFAGFFDYAFTIVAGYFQPLIWLAGFFFKTLSWSGRKYKIGKRGKILFIEEEK